MAGQVKHNIGTPSCTRRVQILYYLGRLSQAKYCSLFLTLTLLLPALLCSALHSTPPQLQALLLLVSASPAGSAAQPPLPPSLPELPLLWCPYDEH